MLISLLWTNSQLIACSELIVAEVFQTEFLVINNYSSDLSLYFSVLTSYFFWYDRYNVTLESSDVDIYPTKLTTHPCCPNQKCYTRLENGDPARGDVKELETARIILRDTGKCNRHGTKVFKPVKVKISISCHCRYINGRWCLRGTIC